MSEGAGRILGIDWGGKRIGLAISDPLRITAQPLETARYSSPPESIEEVARIIRPFKIELAVIGLPLRLDGSSGTQARRARKWGEKLSRTLSLPVVFQDERLTSREAERVLIQADLSRRRRREVTDQLAAQLILQSYLSFTQLEKDFESEDSKLQIPNNK